MSRAGQEMGKTPGIGCILTGKHLDLQPTKWSKKVVNVVFVLKKCSKFEAPIQSPPGKP